MKEEIILAIETVASPASVCLLKGDEILEERFIDQPNQVSSLINKYIHELIINNLNSPFDINKIAVSQGPGSFTGVRVGLSVAKGMTFAIKKPLIGVNTNFAMFIAYQKKYFADNKFDFFAPLIDARKNKAFAAIFDKEGNSIKDSHLINLEEDKFFSQLNENTLLLPLNEVFNPILLKRSFECQPVSFSSPHVAFASNFSEAVYNEQEIAYMEPLYIVNNYIKK